MTYGGPERRERGLTFGSGLYLVPLLPKDEAAQTRAAERAAHLPRRMLTGESLSKRLGLTMAEAEHLIQPWCECYIGDDGWHHCPHWFDERGRARR